MKHRQGLALLMALAALVLVLAGVTAGLAALRGAHQSAWASEVDGRLTAGLRQGERLANAWLSAHAAKVVLPPDGGGILLVDDRLLLPQGEGRLRVVAYDGLAGIPVQLAQRGNALRAALPAALVSLVVPPVSTAQLDSAAFLLDTLEVPADATRYPAPPRGQGRIWRTNEPQPIASDNVDTATEPSLAETIAFRSDGRININTAPVPLLRAAYATLGISGIAEVLEHRRSLVASKPPDHPPVAANGLRLVAESDRWQMLITVSWQNIHRSWWVDFASKSQGSSMVQRHDVRE